jgi:negative regulator of sigma E activity
MLLLHAWHSQLGVSAIVAVVCIAAAVPINSRLVRAAAAQLQVTMKHADTRAKLESELVSGMSLNSHPASCHYSNQQSSINMTVI